MFQLDLKNRKSIYEQIIDNLKELILSEVLKEDEKLPSVRDLSKILTVNPNTIQKAYKELERQNFVYTVSGLGTFVANKSEIAFDQEKLNDIKTQLKASVKELKYLGVSKEDARKILLEILEGRGDWK